MQDFKIPLYVLKAETTYFKWWLESKIDGNKWQPYDAGGVHGEADEFALIKAGWYLPSEDCIYSTYDDEKHVVW